MKMVIKKHRMGSRWRLFPALLSLVLTVAVGCGGLPGEESEEDSDSATSSDGNNQVTGSLNLAAGLNLAQTETIIKATYAKYDEDTSTLTSSGGYALTTKPYPFSITVFQNEAPVCSFRFQIGDNSVGSLEITTNLDLGALTCSDGEAVVSEEKLAGATAEDFKEAVKNGTVDAELLAKLTTADGLAMQMLSFFDERQGHGGGGPGGPGGHDDHHDKGPGGGPDYGGGPGGPGPGGPGYLACPDCGHHGGFEPIDPRACAKVGYSVADWAYHDYRHDQDENYESNEDMVVFLEQNAEDATKYDFVVTETRDGEESVDIFPKVKLGGFGKEFAMIGENNRDLDDLKAEVAEQAIRDQLRRLDTGNQPPPPPTWTDGWCDPLNIANEARAELGYQGYENITTVFKGHMGHMGDPWVRENQRPLCSAIETGSNTLLLVDDFCFDTAEDGSKTLKASLTTDAELVFCNAAINAMRVGFGQAKLVRDGVEVEGCNLNYSDTTERYHRLTSPVDKDTCSDSYNNINQILTEAGVDLATVRTNSWDNNRPDAHAHWGAIEYDMNWVCSKLRLEGKNLQVCYNFIDKSQEPDRQEAWDTVPTPWDSDLIEADAQIEDDKARNAGHSGLSFTRERIDQCVANFDNTVRELENRQAQIASLNKAVEIVSTAKNADGELKYITTEAVGRSHGPGSFKFQQDQMTKLAAVLEKAEASMSGWLTSINTIKSTYATLKTAFVKADKDDAEKCLPDDLTEENFADIYTQYDYASNGVTGDKTKKGLDGWQKAAFNHFQCMNFDENIRKIQEFGVSAPTQGQKDSNLSGAGSVDDLFLSEECEGFYDHRGQCVEMVTCRVPTGQATYITFDDLVDLAEIESGCEEVPEKFVMTGRVLERSETVPNPWGGSTEVPEGTIRAKVLIMTKLPKDSCSITLKFPALDKDSCFDYQNAAGESWSAMTDEQRADADPADYKLAYEDQDASMKELSSREIVEIALFDRTNAEEEGDNDEAILESFFDE